MVNCGSRRRSGVDARGEGVEKVVCFALIRDDGESDGKDASLKNIRGGRWRAGHAQAALMGSESDGRGYRSRVASSPCPSSHHH
eukprot:13269630-Heterocapsa_arctica.AAC.1